MIHYRKSARAKRISIKIYRTDGKVEVIYPLHVSRRQAERFAKENRDWIDKKLQTLKPSVSSRQFEFNQIIKTRYHQIHIHKSNGEFALNYPEKGKYIIRTPDVSSPAYIKSIQQVLTEIYRLEAKWFLVKKTNELAIKFGFRHGKVTVRNQKTRWGSCSWNNNISLNLNLMKLPDHLIEYVIVHELCHTLEKNHGKDFWSLMERCLPGSKKLDKELKKYHPQEFYF
jgi:hypothetical protein